MNRFASSLIGKPVLLKREQAMVGVIDDLIMDPAKGMLSGFIVKEGFGKRNLKAVSERDVIGIGDNFIMIKTIESLGDFDEIIRIKQVLDTGIKISESKVYTVGGTFLGKVLDYTIDLLTGQMTRLYVRPSLSFGLLTQQLIISYVQIVSIEKDRIIVEDATIQAGEKVYKVKREEAEGI